MQAQVKKLWSNLRHWFHTRYFDHKIMIPLMIIIFISLLTQASVAGGQFFMKHFAYIVLGLPVFYFGYILTKKNWLKNIAWIVYPAALGLLIWVSVKGAASLGAQRWINIGGFSMQPAEPAKLACILALAYWYALYPPQKIKDLILSGLIIMIPPFVLILLQPDLGTSLVLIVIYLMMTFWAGVRSAKLLMIFNPLIILILSALGPFLNLFDLKISGHQINIGASLLGIAWILGTSYWLYLKYKVTESKPRLILWASYFFFCLSTAFILRPFGWNLLEPYQQKRLTVFLDPFSDPQGAGYNIIQSLLAVGGGGFTGQGYMQGQLTNGNFVPEQHTDFIFSAFAEEFGFWGVMILVLCFFWIAYRLILLMSQTSRVFDRLVVAGILGFFAFHAFVNIAMNIGLMPITGVPLPLMSYGGTAIWVTLFSLGIAQGVYYRNKRPRGIVL